MRRGRALGVVRILLVLVALAHVVGFLWVVLGRLTYPYELEWMTGSTLDHVERARSGRPIYPPPSSEWIAFIYPPLYYWLSALLGGTVLACRVLSLAATAAQAIAAYALSRLLGATSFVALLAVALFVGAFSYSGFWYDLERSDSLFAALAVVGALALLRARGPRGLFLSGALLGAAVLAKQQAIFYVAGAGAGLLATFGTPRPARVGGVAAFTAGALLSMCAGFGLAFLREGGSSVGYYLFRMPLAHGVDWSLARDALGRDVLLGPVFVAATVAGVAWVAQALRRRSASREEVLFGSLLFFGFVAAIMSRLHGGGWINVLMPWTTFAAIAAAVVMARLEERGWRMSPSAAVIGQLALWCYEPGAYVPRRAAKASSAAFEQTVRRFEETGPVLLPARGHVTRARGFHTAALADVVRVDGASPPDLIAKLRARAYSAVFDDVSPRGFVHPHGWPPFLLEDIEDLRQPLLGNYFVAEVIDPPESLDLVLRAPARPAWIYRPRATPLELPYRELRKRQLAEMDLVLERRAALRRGEAAFEVVAIESMAAAASRASAE